VTVGELFDTLEAEYRANGRRSLKRLGTSLAHLRPTFDTRRAALLTSADVTAYVVARQTETADDGMVRAAANATINRELAALKRAYRLALKAERIGRVPYIPMLQERNVRQGFFDRPQFEAVRSRLAPELRGLVTAAYITGWRVPSELQTLPWHGVDFKANTIRLEPGVAKVPDGRTIVMTRELRPVLSGCTRTTGAGSARASSRRCSIAAGSRSRISGAPGRRRVRRPGCRGGCRMTSGAARCATWSGPGCRAWSR
jgi:hypothetical protein